MVAEMLTLQNQFNEIVNPQWLSAQYNWARAVWVECAELMDHLGYKWWKAQANDRAQCVLEIVDIWHFVMSYELTQSSLPQLTDSVVLQYAETVKKMNGTFACVDHNLSDLQRVAIDKLAHAAAQSSMVTNGSLLIPFFELAILFDVSLHSLFLQYIAKNALNQFRQLHGYKQGFYIKNWHGQEDNEVLAQVMSTSLEKTCPDGLLKHVLEALEVRYASVKT